MDNGWIKIYRKVTENEIWFSETFSRGQAWIDLLLIANHSDGVIRRRGIKINVRRGQVGYSQDSLAERWRWSKNKVRRFLQELVDNSQIEMKTELKNIAISTLITISNYDTYQTNGTEDGTEEKPKTKPKKVPEQECKEEKEKTITTPYQEIVDLYNSICQSLPKVRLCTDERKKQIKARWDTTGKSIEVFRELFEKAENSPYLKGDNDRQWIADFEFIMRPDKFNKILEGGSYGCKPPITKQEEYNRKLLAAI